MVEFTDEELLSIAAALFASTEMLDKSKVLYHVKLKKEAIKLIADWHKILDKIEDELDIPLAKMTRGKLWS